MGSLQSQINWTHIVPRLPARIDRLAEKRPLLVAFYAGPGTGKSTMATGVFHTLKLRGRNVEYVHEVAKDLTWEGRHTALGHQPYIAGKQMMKYDRLAGKVEAIITDTSTLLGLIHMKDNGSVSHGLFKDWLTADWVERDTIDVLLARTERPYNPNGRRQSEDSAREMDLRVKGMLVRAEVPFIECPATEDFVRPLADMVERSL